MGPLVESLPSSGWWRTGPSSPTPTVTTSTASSGQVWSALTPPVGREPATETPVVLSTCPTAPRALATSGSRSVLSPSEPPLVARSATPPGSPGLSVLRDQRCRLLDNILLPLPVCCCKILFVVFQTISTKKIQIKRWT